MNLGVTKRACCVEREVVCDASQTRRPLARIEVEATLSDGGNFERLFHRLIIRAGPPAMFTRALHILAGCGIVMGKEAQR